MNDDLIKQEQLSALVDGEASSVQMPASFLRNASFATATRH